MTVLPTLPRLPSLNALRAFEAAARLGGFAPAAEELRVTPGAITAQIKALEAEIGAPLFERHPRGVVLTDIGQRALPGFIAAFDALGEAVQGLRRDAAPSRVHIATLPALAQLWLAPRLVSVRALLPELEVSVTALEAPPNLKRTLFDLCLFFTRDAPEGGEILARDWLVPVCAPALAERITCPEDLLDVTCLTDSSWSGDWGAWARVALPGTAFTPRGPVFSLYSVAVEEALSGAGVLIARRTLVAEHLARGTLVAPLPQAASVRECLTAWLPSGAGSARSGPRAPKGIAEQFLAALKTGEVARR